MEKKIVTTTSAPAPVGPYSQGVKAGDTLYISGQLPIDPLTGAFPDDGIAGQTERVLQNLSAILAAEGLKLSDVVKTTAFLKDINDIQKFNEIYAFYFKDNLPARSAVQAAALPRGALVEIEAVAVK